MFFVLFPQESLFRDAGHPVHSSVLVVEMNCPLHNVKEFSTLDSNFTFETVLEKCVQTVHVLVDIFHMCLQKYSSSFLKNLYKNWKKRVTLQLPSDWCFVFWTNGSEKQDSIIFKPTYQKKKNVPYKAMSRDNDKKDAHISNEMQLQNPSSISIHKKKAFLSANTIPFYSPLAHNTTAS